MRNNLPRPPKGMSAEAVYQRKILAALKSLMPIRSQSVKPSHTTRGTFSKGGGAESGGGSSNSGQARWS